jgi:hypothetical protein
LFKWNSFYLQSELPFLHQMNSLWPFSLFHRWMKWTFTMYMSFHLCAKWTVQQKWNIHETKKVEYTSTVWLIWKTNGELEKTISVFVVFPLEVEYHLFFKRTTLILIGGLPFYKSKRSESQERKVNSLTKKSWIIEGNLTTICEVHLVENQRVKLLRAKCKYPEYFSQIKI